MSGACQGRSRGNMMVGFVQMARGTLMEKNVEIRADWWNVENDLGNLWEVSWCWLFYGCMVS